MSLRLLVLLSLVLTAAPGRADESKTTAKKEKAAPSVTLAYYFAKLDGKVATYRIQNTLRKTQKVVGTSGKAAQRERGKGAAVSMTRMTYDVQFAKGKRGLGKVKLTPRQVVAKLTENDKLSYTFDSKDGRAPPKSLRNLTRTLGKTATLDITRYGEIRKIRGVRITERKTYKDNFHKLPKHRIALGRGWERKRKVPIPPFGHLHYFTSFRLKSIKPAKDGSGERRKIEAKILVTYEGVGPRANTRLTITKQTGGGHLIFDERGLLIEEKLRSEITYTIKAVAGTEVHTVRSETTRWLAGLKAAKK